MKDFFISYSSPDKNWAEWIAWRLEEAGFSTVLQSWDFRPGSNFALEMHQAALEAERTIAVLSPAFLASQYTRAEWAAAFASDPTATHGKLLPVRVEQCEVAGILKAIVYLDLVGLTADAAATALIEGVSWRRAKPTTPPTFPGYDDSHKTATTNVAISPSRDPVVPKGSIRILHLGSLHFQPTTVSRQHVSPASEIQRHAYEDLLRSATSLGRIDFVSVAGDLILRGQAGAYSDVTDYLERLHAALGLTVREHCFLVPGNHDHVRQSFSPVDKLLVSSLTSEESIARLMSHPPTMGLIGLPLAAFYGFTASLFGRVRGWRPERPWRVDRRLIGSTLVGVVQLNSAWALGIDATIPPLVGEFQVREAMTEAADCDL